MKENRTPWEEIGAWLNDRSNTDAGAKVKAWLSESDENIQLFKEIVDTQLITRKNEGFYEPDQEKLWQELMDRIGKQPKKNILIFRSWLNYAAVAAAIVGAFFLGSLLTSEDPVQSEAKLASTTVFAEPGQRTHLILPDSTKVWLNSGSKLSYSSDFERQRDVYISGECYFEVTKNKHKPFVVHATDLNVKVFGTQFNVKENSRKASSEVVLVEGKVEVLDVNSKSLAFLEPGEHLSLNDRHFQVKKETDPQTLIAWTKGVLAFTDKPFGEVATYLENWYGVQIHLDKSLETNRYTFKVKTESLREMLYLISQFTPIDYQIDGEQVYIKRKS